MKKIACILLLLLLIGTVAFADDNQSAAWIRTLCREAVTDSIDAAYFNPAGTAFLDKGVHVQAMNLSVLQTYSHKSVVLFPTVTDYEANNPIWLFPTARVGYNGGSWAAFFDFSIPAGGGSLDYDKGAVYVDAAGATGGSFSGSSAVFAFALGGSYRLGDMFSFGASGRLLYGKDSLEGTLDDGLYAGSFEAEGSGIGFGGMFGVDYIPFSGFTVAVTVETVAKLEMEYTEVTGPLPLLGFLAASPLAVAKGNKYDADLPWRIRTGIAYELPFGLTVSSTFKYEFYKALEDTLQNAWSVAGSLAYDINDRLEVSVGGSYDIDEVPNVDDYDPLNPELSSFTLAGGVGIEVIEGLLIDVGSLYVFYQDESAPITAGVGFTDMSKKVFLFGFSVTYTF
jgi:long-chain fatty acid transport protein